MSGEHGPGVECFVRIKGWPRRATPGPTSPGWRATFNARRSSEINAAVGSGALPGPVDGVSVSASGGSIEVGARDPGVCAPGSDVETAPDPPNRGIAIAAITRRGSTPNTTTTHDVDHF